MTLLTPTIPSNWQTNRQNLNDFLMSMVAAFQSSVSYNVVRKAWSEIPASYTGEVPLIYLGDIVETITHDAGLRITNFEGSLHYVDVSPDSQEANTRANTFADYFRDLFTANPHITGTDVLYQTGLTEGAIAQGPLTGFMHLALSYIYTVQEGRS